MPRHTIRTIAPSTFIKRLPNEPMARLVNSFLAFFTHFGPRSVLVYFKNTAFERLLSILIETFFDNRDATHQVRYTPDINGLNHYQYLTVIPTKAERPMPDIFLPQGTVTFAGAVGFMP